MERDRVDRFKLALAVSLGTIASVAALEISIPQTSAAKGPGEIVYHPEDGPICSIFDPKYIVLDKIEFEGACTGINPYDKDNSISWYWEAVGKVIGDNNGKPTVTTVSRQHGNGPNIKLREKKDATSELFDIVITETGQNTYGIDSVNYTINDYSIGFNAPAPRIK